MSSKVEMDAPRLWLVLSRCHRALNQIAERSIEEAGLCLTDFAALEALLHKGPLTITQIQSKVPLALGSMTAAVDRLEKKGLIMRTLASDDRRVKVLKLTPEGKRTVEKAFSRHAAELESAMAVLNASEKRQLHVLLKKLGLFAAGAAAETRNQGDKYAIEVRDKTNWWIRRAIQPIPDVIRDSRFHRWRNPLRSAAHLAGCVFTFDWGARGLRRHLVNVDCSAKTTSG